MKGDKRNEKWGVFLLTGVPAVGKTTVASKLGQLIQPLEVISFGNLILNERSAVGDSVSHSELRRHPTREATMNTIKKSTEVLCSKLNELREHTNVIIDSHAIAKDSYGFRASPDSIASLTKFDLSAIFVLHAKYDEIRRRLESQNEGRRHVSAEEISTHERLQDSVAISYGVATGTPVFFVNAQDVEQVAADLIAIMDSLKVCYSRTTCE
jgi:adenylate kinase